MEVEVPSPGKGVYPHPIHQASLQQRARSTTSCSTKEIPEKLYHLMTLVRNTKIDNKNAKNFFENILLKVGKVSLKDQSESTAMTTQRKINDTF
jgi:Asp-tRNA(Asn)/Glu-tRNA(Gln) amidotransferase B subunit